MAKLKNKIKSNNKRKILLGLLVILTIIGISFIIARADVNEYDVGRSILVHSNGGTADAMGYSSHTDHMAQYAGVDDYWINGVGVDAELKDKHGNDHTIGYFDNHNENPGLDFWFYEHVDCVGLTPYLVIYNPHRTGYTCTGVSGASDWWWGDNGSNIYIQVGAYVGGDQEFTLEWNQNPTWNVTVTSDAGCTFQVGYDHDDNPATYDISTWLCDSGSSSFSYTFDRSDWCYWVVPTAKPGYHLKYIQYDGINSTTIPDWFTCGKSRTINIVSESDSYAQEVNEWYDNGNGTYTQLSHNIYNIAYGSNFKPPYTIPNGYKLQRSNFNTSVNDKVDLSTGYTVTQQRWVDIVYDDITYYIKYHGEGGTLNGSDLQTVTVKGRNNTTMPGYFSRPGYSPLGWDWRTPVQGATNHAGDTFNIDAFTKNAYDGMVLNYYAVWQANNETFDLNSYLNGVDNGNLGTWGTADVYINGVQVANDTADYYSTTIPYGSSYTVNDIKAKAGYFYTGSTSYSGTITATTSVFPTFISAVTFNLNSFLDGVSYGNLGTWGTADIYMNGSLVANDVTDYYNTLIPYGASYTINDIKVKSGYSYTGPASYSGKVYSSTTISPSFETIYQVIVDPNGGTMSYNGVSSTNSVIVNDIVGNSSGSFSTPVKPGYTFNGFSMTNTISLWNADNLNDDYDDNDYNDYNEYYDASFWFAMPSHNVTLIAQWTPNPNTPYKVNHYRMNLDGSTYTLFETQNLTGTTASVITPAVKSYVGFQSPTTQTTMIAANGSTVVNYYYTRRSFPVSVSSGIGISSVIGNGMYMYGATVSIDATVKPGYAWVNWNGTFTSATKSQSFTMPANSVTLTANAVATNVNYNVRYFTQNLDGSTYSQYGTTATKTGITDTSITINGYIIAIDGFTYKEAKVGSNVVTIVTIAGNGTTCIDYYYTRNSYTLSLASGVGISGVTGAGTYKYGATVNINATVKVGYTWKNWTGTTTYTTINQAFTMPSNNVTLTANATANTNTPYNVRYFTQNLDGSTYTQYGATITKTGTTDTVINTNTYVISIDGFTYKEAKSGSTIVTSFTILGDGSVCIDYYYTRNSYSVTLTSGVGVSGTTGAGTYKYGATVVINATIKAGYAWKDWTGTSNYTTKNQSFVMPSSNVSLTANATAVNVNYNVRYFTQDLNGSTYTQYGATVVKTGLTDTSVTTSSYVIAITGFTYKEAKAGSTIVTSFTINGDGSTCIDYYYTRNNYTVTLTSGTGISSVVGSGTYKYGATVAIDATVKVGYTWKDWSGTNSYTTKNQSFIMPANNVSLLATATANTNTPYHIRHFTQNLDGSTYTQYGATIDKTGTTDTSINTSSCVIAINGFTYKEAKLGSVVVTSFTIAGDGSVYVDLYYTRNSYVLTVNPNGSAWNGNTTTQTFTMKYGETKVIANPVLLGYTFKSWTMTPTDKASSLAGVTFTMGYADTTIVAQLTENIYNLVINTVGGSPLIENVDLETRKADGTWNPKTLLTANEIDQIYCTTSYNINYETMRATIKDVPIRPGFTFVGWSDQKENGTLLAGNLIHKATPVDKEVYTVYAIWDKKKIVALSSSIGVASSTSESTNVVDRVNPLSMKVDDKWTTAQDTATETPVIQEWAVNKDVVLQKK